jgi:hypothetical protein
MVNRGLLFWILDSGFWIEAAADCFPADRLFADRFAPFTIHSAGSG